jgi:hypothetical protein
MRWPRLRFPASRRDRLHDDFCNPSLRTVFRELLDQLNFVIVALCPSIAWLYRYIQTLSDISTQLPTHI